MPRMTRRRCLEGLGAAALWGGHLPGARAETPPRILIVAAATGGYSIQDSLMALRRSEVSPDRREDLNVYPDEWVEDHGPFRAVRIPRNDPDYVGFETSGQQEFLQRHGEELFVYTTQSSAVNHLVGQQRALNGDGALGGRTLMEHVAASRPSAVLGNVNMASSGFASPGTDETLPSHARPTVISNPWMFSLGLHGHQGLTPRWSSEDVERMRGLRGELESMGPQSEDRRWLAWGAARRAARDFESKALVERLNITANSPQWRLADYGIPSHDAADRLRDAFPYLDLDPFEAQAALAFLLARTGTTSVVTIGLPMQVVDGSDRPLHPRAAFDASHGRHRYYQALVWDRYLTVVSRLVDLLKSEPEAGGGSLWERCVLFMPSEFGRVQRRAPGSDAFGSAHDFEGAGMILSPHVRGGTVWGAVSPETGKTVGFDRRSGRVEPQRAGLSEREALAAVLAVLGLEAPGLPDLSAVRR